MEHRIEIDKEIKPPHWSLFQLSPSELLATREYITDLLKKEKIRPNRSPFGAPLFFERQKGKLRGVIDYRALNRITKTNHAPIPLSDEMFDGMGSAKVFSKLYLRTCFYQIRIHLDCVEKAPFRTKYGHFGFLVMPMDLSSAPTTFHSLTNSIFYDCIDRFMVFYLADLLIYSDVYEKHLNRPETCYKASRGMRYTSISRKVS